MYLLPEKSIKLERYRILSLFTILVRSSKWKEAENVLEYIRRVTIAIIKGTIT